MSGGDKVYDVLGVGFGPSNLALAIALEETSRERRVPCEFRFLEKQPDFTWHGGMLLRDARMQVSFIKDLVSLRDPTSQMSFLNYLKEAGRLIDFINTHSFFPSRLEFNGYLRWAASKFDRVCSYGEEVLEIDRERANGAAEHLLVKSRDGQGNDRLYRARNVVLGAGGSPAIPEAFQGVIGDPRVFHSSEYLYRIAETMPAAGAVGRLAVVGGGQSAAEIFLDLLGRCPNAEIDLIVRGHALRPADNSPFVNEIFNPEFTDFFYGQDAEARSAMLRDYRLTNYGAVDLELIQRIYDVFYQQRVAGRERYRFLRFRKIQRVSLSDGRFEIPMTDASSGRSETRAYDHVILATGYRSDALERLLEPLEVDARACRASRDYRFPLAGQGEAQGEAAVYLQGCCEASHGLNDTLLSVLAVRSKEIAESLFAGLLQSELKRARRSSKTVSKVSRQEACDAPLRG